MSKGNKISLYIYRISESLELVPSQWLDESELERFAKMGSEKRKREYLHSRFLIKSILQSQHGLKNPRLSITSKGKPKIRGAKFNVSHSDDYIVLAVSKDIELGVDVELSRDKKHFVDIARKYFSPTEYEYIFSAKAATEQHKRFKNLWSLKEAYIKAFNGVLNRKSMRIHFDLSKHRIENSPTKKPLTFFQSEKKHISVCAVKICKSTELDVMDVKVSKSLSIKTKKSVVRFKSIPT